MTGAAGAALKYVTAARRWAAVAAGALALVAELAQVAGAHQAARAQAALRQGEPLQALAAARIGTALAPAQPEAAYARLVALRRLYRWPDLVRAGESMLPWHPDSASVRRLLAEAAWNAGDKRLAAATIWEALWRSPAPPHDAAQSWRLALLAGRAAWGDGDARVAAAAVQLQVLADRDPTLTPAQREALRAEAAAVPAVAR